jgi:hypothetical protein
MHATFRGRALPIFAAMAFASSAFGQARVIITEIMYNPNSKEEKGQTEWVEIANVGDQPIDIKDWRLDDEDRFDWGKFTCTLAPGGVAVLINADFLTEEQFRTAWPAADDASAGTPANTCQVITVKWGGIANSPGADNEMLKLLNEQGETVCEVKQAGQWPSCDRPDGSSIYLIDLAASNLSDGKIWKRADKGVAGARTNTKTEIFGGNDVGSPGFVPGLNGGGAVAAKPPATGDNTTAAPPAASPPASQPAAKPANTIDY